MGLLGKLQVFCKETLDYEGVPVRVIDPEHLAALAFQAGVPKRRERAWQLLETGGVDRTRLRTLLAAHELRKQDLPLIAKQRPLRSWERPWPIES